jgi:hypothetical protein
MQVIATSHGCKPGTGGDKWFLRVIQDLWDSGEKVALFTRTQSFRRQVSEFRYTLLHNGFLIPAT